MLTSKFDNGSSIGFIGNPPIDFTSVIITKKQKQNKREQFPLARFDGVSNGETK